MPSPLFVLQASYKPFVSMRKEPSIVAIAFQDMFQTASRVHAVAIQCDIARKHALS